MPLIKATRQRWFEQMKSDYPNLPDDFVNLVLDMYENDKDYLDQITKEEKKKHKGKPLVPKTKLTVEELERLDAIAQENIEKTMKGFTYGALDQDGNPVKYEPPPPKEDLNCYIKITEDLWNKSKLDSGRC